MHPTYTDDNHTQKTAPTSSCLYGPHPNHNSHKDYDNSNADLYHILYFMKLCHQCVLYNRILLFHLEVVISFFRYQVTCLPHLGHQIVNYFHGSIGVLRVHAFLQSTHTLCHPVYININKNKSKHTHVNI